MVALRTVRDVVAHLNTVETMPITAEMLQQFRASHQTYVADLAANSVAKASAVEQLSDENKEHEVYQKRKREIEQKQVDAQKLISEAADWLTKATASKDIADILAPQALLQSGNKMLVESSDKMKALGAPPDKKARKH
jgi:hypothetical protein